MQIQGPGHIHGGATLEWTTFVSPGTFLKSQRQRPIQDELQISELGQLLEKVHDLPDIRADLVAKIRGEIAAGTYETEEKLQIAVERLLDEIGGS